MYNHSYTHNLRHNFHSMGDKPSTQFFDISLIHKNIFISDKNVALNKTQLKKHDIKHIIVAGEELQTKFLSEFNYLKLEIKDSTKQDLAGVLEKTNLWIDECLARKENVLVHCAYGVSRSASVVIGYLIYKFKMSFEESFHFVKQKRPQVKPNEGFREQLKKYSTQRNLRSNLTSKN